MTIKGTDSFATIRPEWAPQLKALGYGFAARYYRRAPLTGGKGNAVSKEEVAALHANGLGFLPVFQNTSNHPSYFTIENADADGRAAVAKAREMGQPPATPIFFAVDCDPGHEIADVVAYFDVVGPIVCDEGWRVGVYGSGLVCGSVSAEFTWLANAKGWHGYQGWFPKADVVQTTLPFTLPFGLQVDGNECRNERCLWMPKVAKHEPYDPPQPWWHSWIRVLLGQRS